ncbi:hypothetical protein [Variovorax ginsengisoli]|uniref:DUF4145 domain-containing protein n=1 Tax=Variovorax ginsengisoli TaxID=363844 RepID=A0ABT9SF00_9BURK|nr:hypothetical protein [Variovorax ginsengisoli]MDP9902940.1 hypothetical protein [Variovorax ginsengisoli]
MNKVMYAISWLVAAYFGVGFVAKAGFPPKPDLLIADAFFVALFLFFLFLPFFNKIKIGSWLELEREVKEAKKETAAAKEELREFKSEVRNSLSVVSTTLNNQRQQTHVVVNNSAPEAATLREQQQKIEETFRTPHWEARAEKYAVETKAQEDEDVAYVLAKVRIDIERLLRTILGRQVHTLSSGANVIRMAGLRQLFDELIKSDPQYESLYQSFNYVNRVCNAAIHGQIVSKEQAAEALKLGALIIDVLKQHPDASAV